MDKEHSGRLFHFEHRVLLADTDPSGRMRLDAVSRVLQDAATLDVENTSLVKKGPWVLRWMELVAHGIPCYLEQLEVKTYCSGLGRAWAERSTVI
jgi:acyl-ACP thioesterase